MATKKRPTVAEANRDLTPDGVIDRLRNQLRKEQDAGLANFANYRRHVDLLVKQRDEAVAEVETFCPAVAAYLREKFNRPFGEQKEEKSEPRE